jgi:hypothetical protein
MMTSIKNLLLPLVACCWFASNAAGAPVQLTQGGWTFGGPLTLTFSGQDANHDGQIDQSELSAFEAAYLLPQGPVTVWSLNDLHPDGFLFADTGNYLFFATNDAYTLLDSSFQGLVSASVVDSFLFPIDITDAAPVAVPEPVGFTALGLAAIAGLSWRTHRNRVE